MSIASRSRTPFSVCWRCHFVNGKRLSSTTAATDGSVDASPRRLSTGRDRRLQTLQYPHDLSVSWRCNNNAPTVHYGDNGHDKKNIAKKNRVKHDHEGHRKEVIKVKLFKFGVSHVEADVVIQRETGSINLVLCGKTCRCQENVESVRLRQRGNLQKVKGISKGRRSDQIRISARRTSDRQRLNFPTRTWHNRMRPLPMMHDRQTGTRKYSIL